MQRLLKQLAPVVAAASLAVCFAQGWSRAAAGFDFCSYYDPTRVWLAGGDPYDHAALNRAIAADFRDPGGCFAVGSPMLPSGLLLFTSLAVFPVKVALRLIWILSFAALVFSLWLMLRLWAGDWSASERWWMVALLAQSRLIQSIAYRGQPTLLMLAATLTALWAADRGRRVLAGAMGAVLSIKFTLGIPVAAYWIWRRQWRPIAWALAIVAALSIPAIASIGPGRVVAGFTDSMRALAAWNHAAPDNTFHLTSWSAITDRLGTGGNIASALLGLAATLFLLFRPREVSPAWQWAGFTALGMVAVYHRAYDAVLLFPVMVMCWDRLRQGARREPAVLLTTAACVLLLLVFSWQSLSERTTDWLLLSPWRVFAPVNAWLCIAVLVGVFRHLRSEAALARQPATVNDAVASGEAAPMR
jgi:hypothetical protein